MDRHASVFGALLILLLCCLLFELKLVAIALQGLVAMSADVEAVHAALLSDRVPQQWVKVGYPSLLPLGGWLKDLQARVAFFQAWLRRGQPTAFWLAAFFFPQVPSDQHSRVLLMLCIYMLSRP